MSELVIVFDEARFLLDGDNSENMFRKLISAHAKLRLKNVVLIFVDILSALSGFSPTFFHDPSRPQRKFKILPPFYAISTYNVCSIGPDYFENQDVPITDCKGNFLNVEANKNPPAQSADLERIQNLVMLFSRGRPLWGSHFRALNRLNMDAIKKAVYYAMQKLSFKSEANLVKNYFGRLAAMAIRFGIWGIMDHSYATTLMSSYMATGIHFAEDGLRMFVHYVPEPIISEAASRLLY